MTRDNGANVVVPTPEIDCPAFRALRMEGIDVYEHFCQGENDYGAMFANLWDRGSPFVIVEHDIIPWPGAIAKLFACDERWCLHQYPLGRGALGTSFGIGKFRPDGPAPANWSETSWRMLDGQVIPWLYGHLGFFHIHEPPVAHARKDVP